MYRVGAAGGSTGPTAYLPPGIRRKEGFNAAFLRKHGAAEGSGIYMTPTGYMTEEAWVAMAEDQAKGIRAMPYICDNPDWYVLNAQANGLLGGHAAHQFPLMLPNTGGW